jgi:hypothetical protein
MLTDIQVKFVQAYLKTLNIAKSAESVGVCKETGSRWLDSDEIQQLIEAEHARVQNRLTIDVRRLIGEISAIANSNIVDYFNIQDTIAVKDLKELPEPVQKCIQSINITSSEFMGATTTRIKLKLYDKLDALKQLCKVFGLEMERVLLVTDSDQLAQGTGSIALPTVSDISDWERQVISARQARALPSPLLTDMSQINQDSNNIIDIAPVHAQASNTTNSDIVDQANKILSGGPGG